MLQILFKYEFKFKNIEINLEVAEMKIVTSDHLAFHCVYSISNEHTVANSS